MKQILFFRNRPGLELKDVDGKQGRVRRWVRSEDAYKDVPVRGGTTSEQKAIGEAAYRALSRGSHLIGSALPRDFVDKASPEDDWSWLPRLSYAGTGRIFNGGIPVSLVGSKIERLSDLAELAQIYRDPRIETCRIFFLRGNKIVGQVGVSSRLPASTDFMPSYDSEAIRHWIGGMKGRLRATGYALFHNHPSGKATPSDADKDLTRAISDLVPGCAGHVVIDHNEYAVIRPDGISNVFPLKPRVKTYGQDPAVSHPYLNHSIMSARDLAYIGKSLLSSDDRAVVVAMRNSGTDQAIVQAISEWPQSDLSGDAMRHFALMNGAGAGLAIVVSRGGEALSHLVKDGHAKLVIDTGAGRLISRRDFDGAPDDRLHGKVLRRFAVE